ncbi:hypothetical protein ACFQ3N_16630 [Virgibacillus byunsanensis]|uniref:Uncharacterized protein n=1 Tax=Virgibacillus byunsanensis TaxID=570945 RepID=A0ABW3LSZ6_9BACI
MAIASVLTSIGIIVVSIIMGFIFFFVISPLPTQVKKKQLEEITSLLINFVIYIWVGKILLNISTFITDPLAILAYPSDSHAFYLATLFIVLNIGYKYKRHNLAVLTLLNSFIPVFLAASFVYEFVQIVWNSNTYTWGYLGLVMLLIVVYMLVYDRITKEKLLGIMLIGWVFGQLMLALFLPFLTVFGYMMAPWFLILFFITSIGLYIYNNGKQVS